MKLLSKRRSIEEVIKSPNTDAKEKEKLRLVQRAHSFAIEELHLKGRGNFTTYVNLKRPYVTYVLRVSLSKKLEPYLFRYPLLGPLPYKGFFQLKEAEKSTLSFDSNIYDTYVRGVTAYSSLGWWKEPVLSSMLSYEDMDLVETVFHEMVHSTVFIKGSVDFNERMATAFSQWGLKQFYLKVEGPQSPKLLKIQDKQYDKRLFSDFISKELDSLRQWYEAKEGNFKEEEKKKRLKDIQIRFVQKIKDQLKTSRYYYFEKISLNNARLLSYKTYVYDLKDFENLFKIFNEKAEKILTFLKELKGKNSPESYLKTFIKSKSSS